MAGLGEVRAQAGVGDFVVLAGRVRVSDHIPGAVISSVTTSTGDPIRSERDRDREKGWSRYLEDHDRGHGSITGFASTLERGGHKEGEAMNENEAW